MFITMCNYPALLIEIATVNYFFFTVLGLFIGSLIGSYIMLNNSSVETYRQYLGCGLIAIVFSFLFLNILTGAHFAASGEITQNEYDTFNKNLVSLNHNNFSDSEKKWLRDFAQCSIQDNEISKFEFNQFDKKYLKYKNAHDVKNSIGN